MKHFIKKVENFVCANCGFEVKGSGYTNHCPKCLFSLHVDDKVPGDRQAKCRGVMEPVGIELKKGKYYLLHKCRSCGKEIKNKVVKGDSFEEIIKVSTF